MKRKILVLGNSHTKMLQDATDHFFKYHTQDSSIEFDICWLKDKNNLSKHGYTDHSEAIQKINSLRSSDLLVLTTLGSMHNIIGLVRHDQPFSVFPAKTALSRSSDDIEVIPRRLMVEMFESRAKTERVYKELAQKSAAPVVHYCPPPPKRDLSLVKSKEYRGMSILDHGFNEPELRLELWRIEVASVEKHWGELGVASIPAPEAALDGDGFLKPEYSANDATHANAAYGQLLLTDIVRRCNVS